MLFYFTSRNGAISRVHFNTQLEARERIDFLFDELPGARWFIVFKKTEGGKTNYRYQVLDGKRKVIAELQQSFL